MGNMDFRIYDFDASWWCLKHKNIKANGQRSLESFWVKFSTIQQAILFLEVPHQQQGFNRLCDLGPLHKFPFLRIMHFLVALLLQPSQVPHCSGAHGPPKETDTNDHDNHKTQPELQKCLDKFSTSKLCITSSGATVSENSIKPLR